MALLCTLFFCSTAVAAQSARTDTLLRRLETAKWRPSTLGANQHLFDLFASDFTTIEYGTDGTFAGVRRVLDARKFMQSGGESALVDAMNKMSFDLSDWHFQHLAPSVVLLSYQVASPQFGANRLWATSIWRRTNGTWRTSFYQASRAQ
ncbi:MAG TPA: hypothetical protein VJ867_13775 [Gemmatimonadaceae bacterium]|nr:hypothetical protein [Gemmatimonadaceae bacterium]